MVLHRVFLVSALKGLLQYAWYCYQLICTTVFQAVNILIKRKEKVDVNLLCKCNTRFLFHLYLSHMSHSLPEVSQQPEYPSQEARVLTYWHHGINRHQWKNMTMNGLCADRRCLARNKRYFKILELSTEHSTDRIRSHYASSCLPTSPLALPALALFPGDLSTNELSFQFVSKILAHLGTLMEDQIGLEPLQLSNFQPKESSEESVKVLTLFCGWPKKRAYLCLLFLVVDTPT